MHVVLFDEYPVSSAVVATDDDVALRGITRRDCSVVESNVIDQLDAMQGRITRAHIGMNSISQVIEYGVLLDSSDPRGILDVNAVIKIGVIAVVIENAAVDLRISVRAIDDHSALVGVMNG